MIFNYHLKNPRILMPIGMMCLVVAMVWPQVLPLTGGLSLRWIHFIRGFLFGISIGLNLCAAVLTARQRRCGGNQG